MDVNKTRLGELAQIAEIVAAVAVVLSLIYVGRGLIDNTAAIRATSVQAITSGTREALLAVAVDEDLSRIVRIGSADRSMLSGDEAYRFSLFSRQRWLFFQGIWIQRNLGVLDDQVWGAYERAICTVISNDDSGDRAEWPNHVSVLDPEFVNMVEECPK